MHCSGRESVELGSLEWGGGGEGCVFTELNQLLTSTGGVREDG